MSKDFIELTEDEFDDRYTLLQNHLNRNAGWAYGDGTGCLFETFGEELAFVLGQDHRTIWTLIDGEDGDMYIISGFHVVNRIGYLLSTLPVPEHITIQVHLPTS